MKADWHMISMESARKLGSIIKKWRGTPYKDNSRVRGGGVDCRNLIVAILDAWSNASQPTPLPLLPSDSGIHTHSAGFDTARAIRAAYDADMVKDGSTEPGDILVVHGEGRRGNDQYGHVMMMTTRKNVAVHASWEGGVDYVGIGQFKILANYRAKDKAKWV